MMSTNNIRQQHWAAPSRSRHLGRGRTVPAAAAAGRGGAAPPWWFSCFLTNNFDMRGTFQQVGIVLNISITCP